MARNATRDPDKRCAACGTHNLPFASFCIACGEPLDEAGSPPSPWTAPTIPDRPPTMNGGATDSPSPATIVHRPSSIVRPAHRETLLGLFVLFLVTGYAVWDWQVSTAQSAAYREGVAAARNKDWDAALSGFERAAAHSDAPRKKAEALRQVTDRDRLYDAGVQAAARHDLGAAISSLSHVQSIQPRFRDSSQRLAAARAQALREGLAGVAYLVTAGPAPGLYIFDAQGLPFHLPLSDKQSLVRAVSVDGSRFVYDRPSEEADYFRPPLSHRTIVRDPFGAAPGDRIPVLAQVQPGGSVSIRPLRELDPAGRGALGPDGLWWYVEHDGNDFEVYYYSLADPNRPAAPTRVTDLAHGKRLVALDAAHGVALLAQPVGDQGVDQIQTRLFLATSANPGSDTVLETVRGEVMSALISPDGGWLLYITWEYYLSPTVETAWVLPLDLTGGAAITPRLLTTASWSFSIDTAPLSRLTVAFLPPDGKPLRVIISRTESAAEQLAIYDLREAQPTYVWSGERDLWPMLSYPSGFSHDGSYLTSVRRQRDGASLEVLALAQSAGSLSGVGLPRALPEVTGVRFAPHDDYLVLVEVGGRADGTSGETVYAAPLGSNGTTEEPAPLARVQSPDAAGTPGIALPSTGTMLAYVSDKQELHAVFFNGAGDTLVAGGVGAIWDLKATRDLSWDR